MRVTIGERHIAVDAAVFYEVDLFAKGLRDGDRVSSGEFLIGIVLFAWSLALGFNVGRCEVVPCEGIEVLQIELCLRAGRCSFHDWVRDILGQGWRLIKVPESDLVGARQHILRCSTLPRVVLLLEVRPQIVCCLSSLLRLPYQDVGPRLIQLPLRGIVQDKYGVILSIDMEDLIFLKDSDRVIILLPYILLSVCL